MKRSGLGVLALGLEKLHFSPENTRVSYCTMLLGRLKETLLVATKLPSAPLFQVIEMTTSVSKYSKKS